jgi:hypothetical protein
VQITNAEKIVLLSALAQDIQTTGQTAELFPFPSSVIQKVVAERLELLNSLVNKVTAEPIALTPGYFTRDGHMVEFIRNNSDKSDYSRLRVWRLIPSGEEIYTSPDGQIDTDDPNYLAIGHPLDVMSIAPARG